MSRANTQWKVELGGEEDPRGTRVAGCLCPIRPVLSLLFLGFYIMSPQIPLLGQSQLKVSTHTVLTHSSTPPRSWLDPGPSVSKSALCWPGTDLAVGGVRTSRLRSFSRGASHCRGAGEWAQKNSTKLCVGHSLDWPNGLVAGVGIALWRRC